MRGKAPQNKTTLRKELKEEEMSNGPMTVRSRRMLKPMKRITTLIRLIHIFVMEPSSSSFLANWFIGRLFAVHIGGDLWEFFL
jgi:hypothetical protein